MQYLYTSEFDEILMNKNLEAYHFQNIEKEPLVHLSYFYKIHYYNNENINVRTGLRLLNLN